MKGIADTNQRTKPLFTSEFLSLCLVIITAFCNVSVFYSFYNYLGIIEIPVIWRGFLVGLEPMAAFCLRLFVVPWLHGRNAYGVLMLSMAFLIIVSLSYLWVRTVSGLVLVRIVHGATFVMLTSAVISLMVNFIPQEKSGQGFSALAIATMIPYAVVPSAAEALMPYVRTAADIYAGVSVLSVFSLILMFVLCKKITGAIRGMDNVLTERLRLQEIKENFQAHQVLTFLLGILFVYLAHSTYFYFMKDLTIHMGVGNVGVFFSLTTFTMIAVRLLGTILFDRLDKLKLLIFNLFVLMLCFIILPVTKNLMVYYCLAVIYGGSIGIAFPVLNALLFSASAPRMQGLNTNMALFAMDAGFFLTPYLGGILIASGADFKVVFYTASGFVFMCLILMTMLLKREERPILL